MPEVADEFTEQDFAQPEEFSESDFFKPSPEATGHAIQAAVEVPFEITNAVLGTLGSPAAAAASQAGRQEIRRQAAASPWSDVNQEPGNVKPRRFPTPFGAVQPPEGDPTDPFTWPGKAAVGVANIPSRIKNIGVPPESPAYVPLIGEKPKVTLPRIDLTPQEEAFARTSWNPFVRFLPETAGVANTVSSTAEGFIQPESAFLLPFLGGEGLVAKAASLMFAEQQAEALPEQVQEALTVLKDPNATRGQKIEALARPGVSALLTATMARHGLKERIPNASQVAEATKVHGDVRPQPGEGQGQMPAEEGSAGIQPQAGGGLPQKAGAGNAAEGQTRVLLNQALENNRQLGLGHDIEVHPNFSPDLNDPENLKVFKAGVAEVDANGNLVRPGRIKVNQHALAQWLKLVPEAQRGKALISAMAEEGIHANVTPTEALAYLDTLTKAEVSAGKKLYLRGHAPEAVGLNDVLLGHELIRQRMQRLLRLTPTELAEAAGKEKWTQTSLEMIGRVIRRIREFVGTKAAKAGKELTQTMLDRYQSNLDHLTHAGEEAVSAVEGGGVELEGAPTSELSPEAERALGENEPFSLRRSPDRERYEDLVSKFRALPFQDKFKPEGIALQKQIEELKNRQPEAGFVPKEGAAPTQPAEMAKSIPGVRFDGEVDFKLAGRKPKWQFTLPAPFDSTFLVDQGTSFADVQRKAGIKLLQMQKQIPEYADAEKLYDQGNQPAAIRRRTEEAGHDRRELTDEFWQRWSFSNSEQNFMDELEQASEDPELFKQLHISPFATSETVKNVLEHALYQYPKGPLMDYLNRHHRELVKAYRVKGIHSREPADAWKGFVQDKLSQLGYESDEINQMFEDPQVYMEYRDELKQKAPALVQFMEDPDPRDAAGSRYSRFAATDDRPNSSFVMGGEMAQEPAALRRKKEKGKVTGELFLPPVSGEQPRGGTELSPNVPVSASKITEAAAAHLSEQARPHFEDFAKEVRGSLGDIKPGQLRDAWGDAVWKRVTDATGKELSSMVRAMGLTKELHLETTMGSLREIPDKAPAIPPIQTRPQIPGITRPHFTMPARPIEAPGVGPAGRPTYGPFDVGFKGRTSAESRAQFTKPQQLRARVQAAIANKLLAEAEGGRKKFARKTVEPEEVATPDPEKQKQPVYQTFSTADQTRQDLGTVLTDDASSKGGAKVTVLQGGKVQFVTKKGLARSITKRVTAIMSNVSGKVFLVSTYRDGRRGPVLLDPDAPGDTHSRLESILPRFRVVASVLLDEPVQNFYQRFDSLSDFNNEFGKPAKANAERGLEYEQPPTEIEPEVAAWRHEQPITPQESASLFDSIEREVGKFTEREDVLRALPTMEGDALSAAIKLSAEISRKNPEWSGPQVVDELARTLYENHTASKNFEEFQSRTMGQGPSPKGAQKAAAGALAAEQAGAATTAATTRTGARELTLPRFARKSVPVETPEEFAARQAEASKPQQAATLLRVRQKTQDQFHGVLGMARATIARHGQKQELSLLRDRADNLSGVQALESRMRVAMPSTGPTTPEGNAQALAGSRAINHSYDTLLGSANPNPAHLPGFLALARDGEAKALRLLAAPTDATLQALGLADLVGLRKGQIQRVARDWRDGAQKLQKEVQFAIDHFGEQELMNTATLFRTEMRDQLAREHGAGIGTREVENYMPGYYEGEAWDDSGVHFGGVPALGRMFSKPKSFKHVYEAISKGPFIPKSYNVADIAASRTRSGQMKIAKRAAFKAPLNMIDPVTRTPIAIEMQMNPLTHQWEIAAGQEQRTPVSMTPGSRPLAFRKGYSRLMNNLYGESAVPDWIGGKLALTVTANLKHGFLLVADTFHLGRLADYMLGVMGTKFGWRGGYSVLSVRPADMPEAVRRGIIPQSAMDWALGTETVYGANGAPRQMTRHQIGRTLIDRGLNVGRITDALYKHLVDSWDVTIKGHKYGVGAYNRFLFDKFTPGAMVQTAVTDFIRLNNSTKGVNATDVAKRVVRDTNILYGSLGRQGIIKNPTVRDFAQMIFLAPQWVEGLISKEARFLKRTATAPYKLATQGVGAANVEFGTIGRGIGRGLVSMFLLTQALNYASRGKSTFENEEEGHELDAWMPDFEGGPGIWISPMSIFLEMTHQAVSLARTKPKVWDAIRQIGDNKLGPIGRALVVLKTGEEPGGVRPTTTGGVIGAAAKQLAPVPISFGRVGQYALSKTGLVNAPTRGEMTRQMFSSAGVKAELAKRDLAQVQEYERRFKEEVKRSDDPTYAEIRSQLAGGMTFEATDEPSYAKLRQLVRNEDEPAVNKMVQALRETGKSDDQILKAMQKFSDRNFAWSNDAEDLFMAWLQEKRPGLYSDAHAQKQTEFQRFVEMFQEAR